MPPGSVDVAAIIARFRRHFIGRVATARLPPVPTLHLGCPRMAFIRHVVPVVLKVGVLIKGLEEKSLCYPFSLMRIPDGDLVNRWQSRHRDPRLDYVQPTDQHAVLVFGGQTVQICVVLPLKSKRVVLSGCSLLVTSTQHRSRVFQGVRSDRMAFEVIGQLVVLVDNRMRVPVFL
jgi:hypothetical protein